MSEIAIEIPPSLEMQVGGFFIQLGLHGWRFTDKSTQSINFAEPLTETDRSCASHVGVATAGITSNLLFLKSTETILHYY